MDLAAEINVDGKGLGKSPLQAKVPLCSKELVALHKAEQDVSAVSYRERNQEHKSVHNIAAD